MKQKEKNREIEELFRKEFSGYEVEPSPGFWKGFSRQLEAREFFRFNPGRINVWYIGVAVAGIITAVSILKGIPEQRDLAPDIIIENYSVKEPVTRAEESTAKRQSYDDFPARGSREASGKVTSVDKADLKNVITKTDVNTRDEKIRESLAIGDPPGGTLVYDNEVKTDRIVRPGPTSEFKVSTQSGCLPLTISFENLSRNYDSCVWEFGDGGYSTVINPVWVFDEKGDYTVSLVTFGENGRKSLSRQIINAYPAPEARFEISGGDAVIPNEEVIFFNYSTNSVSWDWNFGDGNSSTDFEPVHSYEKTGSYSVRLIAKSEFGCVDSMTITNAFDDNSCFLRFPNAFIPNEGGPTGGYFTSRSDEQSEVFHPVWSGVTQYQLRIFSRMGILVFETSDIEIGWDGYIKGKKAEPGVYIWKVRGLFKNGDPFVMAGDVTILPYR